MQVTESQKNNFKKKGKKDKVLLNVDINAVVNIG